MDGPSEIVEVGEDFEVHQMGRNDNKRYMLKQKHVLGLEEDIDRLFQALDIGTSLGEKSRMKRPMRASTSQAPGIGMPESANLKQALRGLCILQASEMAAMKKQSLKSANPPVVGTMKKTVNRDAMVETVGEPDPPLHGGSRAQVMKKSSLPNKVVPRLSQELPLSAELPRQRFPNESKHSSIAALVSPRTRLGRAPPLEKVVPLSPEASDKLSNMESQQKGKKIVTKYTKGQPHTLRKELELSDVVPSRFNKITGLKEWEEKGNGDVGKGSKDSCNKTRPETCTCSAPGDKLKTSRSNSPRLTMLALRNKNFVKRQAKVESPLASSPTGKRDVDQHHGTCDLVCPTGSRQGSKEPPCSSTQKVANASSWVDTDGLDSGDSVIAGVTDDVANMSKIMRSKEKGGISQSSKSSSIGEYSNTTNNSGESSSLSDSSTKCMNRPHMSKDVKWEAVQSCVAHHGKLSLKHFKLLRRLGSGDIGTVYLAQLIGTDFLFALKVMDNEFLSRRKKLLRAQTEREILQMLDHPFLPTLYCYFTTDKLSCLVMEYCPGGDLHVIRQKQTLRSFSEQAARFYIAEVLLALEYLHMLGVVYRDLKPENVLVREDGHIMLSDFDLSLRCIVNPTVTRSSSHNPDPRKKVPSPCNGSNCINPFCLQPSWEATSCFSPRLLTSSSKIRKARSEDISDSLFPQLIVEPTDARSNSFVGTHEYLAPEIIRGDGHGSAVDWWTLGIFLFELLYGKTPFKGSSNEETVANVISKPLRFPDATIVSFYARDLIRGLLVKEPENRMGFIKGAAEVKQHPFFEGLNWALIRCAVPPERPKMEEHPGFFSDGKEAGEESNECDSGEGFEFELF